MSQSVAVPTVASDEPCGAHVHPDRLLQLVDGRACLRDPYPPCVSRVVDVLAVGDDLPVVAAAVLAGAYALLVGTAVDRLEAFRARAPCPTDPVEPPAPVGE